MGDTDEVISGHGSVGHAAASLAFVTHSERSESVAASHSNRTIEFLSEPSVKSQLVRVMPTVIADNEIVNDALWYQFRDRGPQSPIEVIFAGWWVGIDAMASYPNRPSMRLIPQIDVEANSERYRLDFQIALANPSDFALAASVYREKFPLIGVELDGHAFHERTKQQVSRRDKRDRDLQMDGWKIFHISGSELYRNGYEAVQAVYLYAHDKVIDLYAAQHHAEQQAEMNG